MYRIAVVCAAIALSGCQHDEPTVEDKMAGMTQCQKVSYVLTNRFASHETKAVAIEVGRNAGCFGQPQEQRVRITVR